MTEPTPLFRALDHVLVAVEDLAAAETRATAILGRAPSWRGEHPGMGSANVLYRLDNTYLELIAPTGEGALADILRTYLEARGEGPFGLSLRAGDLAEAVAEARRRGLDVPDVEDREGLERDTHAVRRWRMVRWHSASSRGLFLILIEHVSPPSALPWARLADGVDEGAAVAGLDHVVICASDPDASLFGRFGLRQGARRPGEALWLRVGGTTIEVVGDKKLSAEVEHYWGTAWRVRDIGATHARFIKAGLKVSETRDGRKPGTRVFTLYEGFGPTLIIGPA